MKAIPPVVDDVEARVRATLATQGRLGERAASLPAEASLTEAGLSSLACVDVMLALESRYGEFPESLLSARVFRSVSSITAALQQLQHA